MVSIPSLNMTGTEVQPKGILGGLVEPDSELKAKIELINDEADTSREAINKINRMVSAAKQGGFSQILIRVSDKHTFWLEAHGSLFAEVKLRISSRTDPTLYLLVLW